MARTCEARDPAVYSFGNSGRPNFLAHCLIAVVLEMKPGYQPLRRVVCPGLRWRHLHFAQPKNWVPWVNTTDFLASRVRNQVKVS